MLTGMLASPARAQTGQFISGSSPHAAPQRPPKSALPPREHHPTVTTLATSNSAAVAVERRAERLRHAADAALQRLEGGKVAGATSPREWAAGAELLLGRTCSSREGASSSRVGQPGEEEGFCGHCRYPCHSSGLSATCEAGEYLRMWDADSAMKPAFFDSTWTGEPPNTRGMAVVSMGGRCGGQWKQQNQDSFLLHAFPAATSVPAIVVGVFDGHGPLGASASRKVRESMLGALGSCTLPPNATGALSQMAAEQCLLQVFARAEENMGLDGRDFSKSGSTAALCMLLPDRIVAAWAGDSRAVVGVRGNAGEGYQAHELTSDHKPDSPSELARIAASGGRVDRLATDSMGNPIGPFRIFLPGQWAPGLAVARSFGDFMASSIGVVPTPEFAVFELPERTNPLCSVGSSVSSLGSASASVSSGGNRARGRYGSRSRRPGTQDNYSSGYESSGYSSGGSSSSLSSVGVLRRAPPPNHLLIVASDGLWEFVSSRRAVEIAGAAATAEDAAHALMEAAQKEWALRYRGRNCDDITVAVAYLD